MCLFVSIKSIGRLKAEVIAHKSKQEIIFGVRADAADKNWLISHSRSTKGRIVEWQNTEFNGGRIF